MDRRILLTKRLAILTAAGMFLVLLMGANVTATGSGEGCGNDWPLCQGRFLPGDYRASIIEYSHRIVTGAEGFLVLGTMFAAWGLRKRFPEFKILVPAMVFTVVLQALMGAAAVKWPTSAAVMASHFGISLICLASAALIARILIDNGRHKDPSLGAMAPPSGFRFLMITSFVMSILVAYIGAYVRHTHSEIACGIQWPLCNGAVIPEMGNNVDIHFGHRISAVIISLTIAGLFAMGHKYRQQRPDLFAISRNALIVVLLQVIAGGMVVLSTVQLVTTLLHAALMAILFVTLADGVLRVLPGRSLDRSQAPALSSQRVPASGPGD